MTCSKPQDTIENDGEMRCALWHFLLEMPARVADINPRRTVNDEMVEEARLIDVFNRPS